jgi:hypothetical protein
MKTLFASIALAALSVLISAGAIAGTTITLAPDGPFHCYNTGLCLSPPTDSTTAVVDYVQLTCGYQCIAVSVDEVRYYATGVVPQPVEGVDGGWSVQDVLLYAADGTYLWLSAQWTLQLKQGNSGRAHYWIHTYTLLDGTVGLP